MKFVSVSELTSRIDTVLKEIATDSSKEILNIKQELILASDLLKNKNLKDDLLDKLVNIIESSLAEYATLKKVPAKVQTDTEIDSLIKELEINDVEAIKRIKNSLSSARNRIEKDKETHCSGVKVKRVPPKEKFDAADIAAELGMLDLAKELTVEEPKPLFPTKKEGNITVKEHYKKQEPVPDITLLDIEEIEELVLKFTKQILVAERNLELAQRLLSKAKFDLEFADNNKILSIIRGEKAATSSLKEDLEQAFKDSVPETSEETIMIEKLLKAVKENKQKNSFIPAPTFIPDGYVSLRTFSGGSGI